jgi:MFS family permease
VLVAAVGACLLLGSFVSPIVRRLLPVRAVLLLELWTWIGCAGFVFWPNVYVLVACILPTAVAIPSTDSVVHGYRIAMTPDRLLGRAESATSTIALLIAPLGPLLAGILLDAGSARATIAVFAVAGLVLAPGNAEPVDSDCAESGRAQELPDNEPAGRPACVRRARSAFKNRSNAADIADDAATPA